MKRQELHQTKRHSPHEQEAVHRDFCEEKIHECLFHSQNACGQLCIFFTNSPFKKTNFLVRQKVSVSSDMFWARVVQTKTLSEAAALTTRGARAPLKRFHLKDGEWYSISGLPASEAERKCLAYTPGGETLAITGRLFLKMIDKPQSDDFIGIIFSWLSMYPWIIFLANKHFSKIIL